MSNQVSVIEESPKRSFYSVINDDNPLPTSSKAIVFKTPPSKLMSPRIIGQGNKNLSSTALRSLLVSDFSSPLSTDTPTNSQNGTKYIRSTTPELFTATPHMTTPRMVTPKSFAISRSIATPTTSSLLAQYQSKESPLGSPRVLLTKLKPSNYVKNSPLKSSFGFFPKSHSPINISHSPDPALSNDSTPLIKTHYDNCIMLDEEDDNASSMAFALSTPTKGDLYSFNNCLEKWREI